MQWSVERFIQRLFVFSAIFGAAVLQRVFSCILFLSIIFEGVRVVSFFQDANHEQQLVYNVFSGDHVFAFC